MRKGLFVLIVCALVLGVSGAPVQAVDAPMSPAACIEAVYAAVEAQDLDTAATHLADDVVLVLVPPPPGTNGTFVGKEAVLGWYADLIRNNFAIELGNVEESGNRVTLTNLTWVDDLPLAPVEFDGAAVVQNGLVKTISWVLTPETMDRLMAAGRLAANEALAHRYIDEMWNAGDAAAAAEILAEDFVDIYPRPDMAADKAGLIADAASFHERGYQNRLDDLVVTPDQIIMRVAVMAPGEGGTTVERMAAVIYLGVKDGQIADRRVALFGWD